MSATADSILTQLQIVDAQRAQRAAVPGLNDKVVAVKSFQQRRFSHTYADLLASDRYGAASRFFLNELYGPTDFTRRDAQFARVVPALVRLFPKEIVATVATLAELHALSETLDTAMGHHCEAIEISPLAYVRAWQRTGREPDRQRQIALTLAVAQRLDRFTRKPLLRKSLRLMRAPARAAGLGELQQFLERGFDTFRAMRGAQEFSSIVQLRERTLASSVFQADLEDAAMDGSVVRALERLPPEDLR